MIYRNIFLIILMLLVPACGLLAPENPPDAMVIPMDGRLRAHRVPTLSSETIFVLEPAAPVEIVGRTADQAWVQVRAADGGIGWVVSDYILVFIDLPPIPVTTDLGGLDHGVTLPPEVVEQARAIFQRGQERGKRANVFSKVGDSISESPHFLRPFASRPYNLGDYQYLQGAVDYYSAETARNGNSFGTISLAVGTGWSSDAVMRPEFADPTVCFTGETPLACEYRVVRPAVALIMFGTNDLGHFDTVTYEYKLQQIIEYSIEQGVIPVVSTIPVRLGYEGKTARFNEAVVRITGLYHVPLWDYGAAMAALPNYGLDTDGVHPSIPAGGLTGAVDFRAHNLNSGYVIRNLTALQMLDVVWGATSAPR